MGWWSINNIEEGGIDRSEQGKSLYNGDSPADILGDAINKVIKEYQRAWNNLVLVFEYAIDPIEEKVNEHI